jgi:hypothetical protein
MTLPDLSLRTLSRTRLALVLFALLTTITIVAQTWWAVAQDRQQTVTSETNNGMVAVRLLEEHASQTCRTLCTPWTGWPARCRPPTLEVMPMPSAASWPRTTSATAAISRRCNMSRRKA